DRPRGERFGPIIAPPGPPNLAARSEQGSWLNCTPNSGPLSSPTVVGAGGKCGCTIMLAGRREKALPLLERYAPVIALAMAAASAGTSSPRVSISAPFVAPGMAARDGGPFMRNTAGTLPTRSVAAVVAGRPRVSA